MNSSTGPQLYHSIPVEIVSPTVWAEAGQMQKISECGPKLKNKQKYCNHIDLSDNVVAKEQEMALCWPTRKGGGRSAVLDKLGINLGGTSITGSLTLLALANLPERYARMQF